MLCRYCGNEFTSTDQPIQTEIGYVCSECLEENFVRCGMHERDQIDIWMPKQKAVIHNGVYLCDRCWDLALDGVFGTVGQELDAPVWCNRCEQALHHSNQIFRVGENSESLCGHCMIDMHYRASRDLEYDLYDQYKCHSCGHYAHQVYSTATGLVCNECYHSAVTCEDCECRVVRAHVFARNRVLCPTCMVFREQHDDQPDRSSTMTSRCASCRRPVHSDGYHRTDGVWCNECSLNRAEELRQQYEHNLDTVIFCAECNEVMYYGNSPRPTHSERSRPVCIDCNENIAEREREERRRRELMNSEYVGDYHEYDRAEIYQRLDNDNTKVTYGIELEIDTDHDDANKAEAGRVLHELSEEKSLFFMERDGSLSPMGIEIITQPASLRYMTQEYPWDEICTTAVQQKYRSNDNTPSSCGLHVNVCRNAFRNFHHQLKTAALVYGIQGVNEKIGRRVFNDYCKGKELLVEKTHVIEDSEHHDALDAEGPTVEFRFFKGTLKPDAIRASIEYVDALIAFARQVGTAYLFQRRQQKIKRDLLQFIHKANYKYLIAYMQERGIDEHSEEREYEYQKPRPRSRRRRRSYLEDRMPPPQPVAGFASPAPEEERMQNAITENDENVTMESIAVDMGAQEPAESEPGGQAHENLSDEEIERVRANARHFINQYVSCTPTSSTQPNHQVHTDGNGRSYITYE